MKSRLTFISAFSIMVAVTLMKTAVAKNQSQSTLNIKTFPKVFDNPVNILFLGGCPGIPWLPLRDATAETGNSQQRFSTCGLQAICLVVHKQLLTFI